MINGCLDLQSSSTTWITSRDEPAIVIDQDGDCNTGDAGAMYTPGEVFTDAENGISVSIDSGD